MMIVDHYDYEPTDKNYRICRDTQIYMKYCCLWFQCPDFFFIPYTQNLYYYHADIANGMRNMPMHYDVKFKLS